MKKLLLLCIVTVLCAAPRASYAHSGYLTAFNTRYGTASTRLNSCLVCHDEDPGSNPPADNPYGVAFAALPHSGSTAIAAAFTTLEPQDSDSDGFSNLAEIQARTFPGNASDFPAVSPVIQVTPSSLNLGSIQSGTTTDGVFTVRNTGGGTLSGGASVSTPFSIIGTATYSLGSNQTQAITIRFSPSGAGSYSNRVTFTGGAGTSNLVSGSAFAAWQADILRARPDGRQQLLWRHLAGDVVDGKVSLWTLNTNATLQSAATFGPYSGWSVADMPVSRFDNTPHLVWTNTTGAISIWNLDSSGSFASAQNYGPYSGWSYRAVAISSTNNDQWVLWTHTTGQASLWRLSSNSVLQATSALGPFTGWSAEELAISPVDGKVRLLWRHTDGTQSLWRLSSTGAFEAANTFGPFTGWSVQTLTLGPVDNQVRLLWENTSGAISLWRLTTNDSYEASTTYGPFSGWQSLGLTMRPDNKLQLPWDRTSDHAFSLWRLSITETLESAPTFGPYPSWQVWDGDVDGVSKVHLLWRNANGQISLWRLSPTGTIENAANFGPY